MFAEMLQSLTQWLYQNPHWALFFTFLISFSESLAIVGSIVPGTVTMTAIGILAGTGVMRIDLTMIAAILGAIAGDSASYFIGYYYKEKLTDWWLFAKYPHWLVFGKQYFHRHGGKSVFIGRFAGPLRSIIPLVAGMMGMNQWRFLSANITSAIGWSILYVVPGILIGAASHELSAESATRLFVAVLLFLGGIWLFSILLKWLFIRMHYYLRRHLHGIWRWSHQHRYFSSMIKSITPRHERHYYQTAILFFSFFLSLLALLVMFFCLLAGLFTHIDQSFWLLMQSIHLSILDNIFVFINALTEWPVILGVLISVVLWLFWHKQIYTAVGLLAMLVFNVCLNLLMGLSLYIARPDNVLMPLDGSAFPNEALSLTTSLLAFILFFTYDRFAPFFIILIRRAILLFILLAAFASLYLGDNWLSINLLSLTSGIMCSSLFWLLMRTDTMNAKSHMMLLEFTALSALLLVLLMNVFDFHQSRYEHSLIEKVERISYQQWWGQKKPMLPLYRLNRLGDAVSLLNIQFAGQLGDLQQALEKNGWQTESASSWWRLIQRFSQGDAQSALPLLNQLYQNQKPKLVMIWKNKTKKITYVLRLWNARYIFQDAEEKLWIGSVHRHHHKKLIQDEKQKRPIDPLTYLLPALDDYQVRRVQLPEDQIKHLPYQSLPVVILISSTS